MCCMIIWVNTDRFEAERTRIRHKYDGLSRDSDGANYFNGLKNGIQQRLSFRRGFRQVHLSNFNL